MGKLTLSQYVKKRNGVPLGAPGSLQNMLMRSLSAPNFSTFWLYWNPIWGFYLGNYVMRPLAYVLPKPLAVLLTFVTSGLLHDVAILVVKREHVGFLTLWFTFMGLVVIFTSALKINVQNTPVWLRVLLNIVIIGGCFVCAKLIDISRFT